MAIGSIEGRDNYGADFNTMFQQRQQNRQREVAWHAEKEDTGRPSLFIPTDNDAIASSSAQSVDKEVPLIVHLTWQIASCRISIRL